MTFGVAAVFATLLVLIVLAVVVILARPRPSRLALPGPARVHAAQVASMRDRLGHDVQTLVPGDDPVARQALSDAAERWSMCSLLLERAGFEDDPAAVQGELRASWQAAAEGLTSTRLVRQRLGLDPGPDIPLPPALP